jgi:hypothetical protein
LASSQRLTLQRLTLHRLTFQRLTFQRLTFQRLTTVIARHPELPAASKARIVIALLPVKSGTLTDQIAVPDARPPSPNESVHFTAVTPALSLAVPLMVMLAAEVETIVDPGDVMLTDGGVLSAPGVAGGCTGG